MANFLLTYIFMLFIGISGFFSEAWVIPQSAADKIELIERQENASAGSTAGTPSGNTGSSGNVAALKSTIANIEKNVNQSVPDVRSFKGGSIKGLIGLLQINSDVVALGDSIMKTTSVAQNMTTLDQAGSVEVGQQFLALQPQIDGLLSTLQMKRPEFDKAGFKILDVTSLIRDDLTIQQKSATSLGGALTKVLDPSFQPVANQIVGQIQSNFSTAVKAFDGRGGKIKIPTKAVPTLSNLLNDVAGALGIGGGGGGKGKGKGVDPAAAALPGDPAFDAGQPDEIPDPMAKIPDTNLKALGPNENDLTGIPPPVLIVLRKYDII